MSWSFVRGSEWYFKSLTHSPCLFTITLPTAQEFTAEKCLIKCGRALLKDAALWEEVNEEAGQPAMGLSGGQQQEACVYARTLAMMPDVIYLMNHRSALDPISTGKIESLMEILKGQLYPGDCDPQYAAAVWPGSQTALLSSWLGEMIGGRETKRIF